MLLEFKIRGLVMDPTNNSPIVLLQDCSSDILLPIWVGIFEANAIALQIEKVDTSRPMTHDLIKNIFQQLDMKIQRIIITNLKENTFHALLELNHHGRLISLDCRPSDALAIAMRMDATIFVSEEVILKSQNTTMNKSKSDPEGVKEWLEGLDPEDLGKYKM
jgi:uncharacterized protein